jgi:hypothetical protein
MTTAVAVEPQVALRRRLVDAAPPLSEQTRAELRELFRKARLADST